MPAPSSARRTPAAPTSPEPATETHESAARVLRRFRIVFNAVKTHFQQVERAAGLGGAQLWALSVVAAQPGIGVSQLARAMDVHQTTASNLVKQLLAGELVEAARDDTDRRSVRLSIRPRGRRLLARAPGPFSGVLPEALDRLPPDVLARLEADLGVLIELLDADRRAGRKPLAQM